MDEMAGDLVGRRHAVGLRWGNLDQKDGVLCIWLGGWCELAKDGMGGVMTKKYAGRIRKVWGGYVLM
jgi:hypothetical protein